MSVVLKKEEAERVAFNYKPKAIKINTSTAAKDFVSLSDKTSSEFHVADIVAKQSGVLALRKKQLEAQVEETVLVRLKDIEEQAYKQAHELGRVEGSEQAYNEQKEILQTNRTEIENAIKSLDSLIENLCKQYEALIMKMIFQIAERIARHEIKMNEQLVIDVLHGIVTELQGAEKVKVFMNPDDLKFVEELRAKDSKQAENLERVKIEPKAEVSRGGCFVETEFGTIDATVEQRVEKAWQAIESKLPVVQPAPPASGKSSGQT